MFAKGALVSLDHFGKLAVLVAAVGVLTCGFTRTVAQEVWSAREGTITVNLDYETLERLGLQVVGPNSSRSPDWLEVGPMSETFLTYTFTLPLDGGGGIQFAVLDDGQIQLFTTHLRAVEGITFRRAQAEVTVLDFALLEERDATTVGPGDAANVGHGPAHFEVSGFKAGMNRRTDTFGLAGRELSISLALAVALDRVELTGVTIGRVVVSAPSEWIGGAVPEVRDEDVSPFDVGERAVGGPDMVFCQLANLGQFGRSGDIVGLSELTTSWNTGTEDLPWFNNPDPIHPFIVMNLFRLKTVDGSEQFEQIGQSWIKHGFFALSAQRRRLAWHGLH